MLNYGSCRTITVKNGNSRWSLMAEFSFGSSWFIMFEQLLLANHCEWQWWMMVLVLANGSSGLSITVHCESWLKGYWPNILIYSCLTSMVIHDIDNSIAIGQRYSPSAIHEITIYTLLLDFLGGKETVLVIEVSPSWMSPVNFAQWDSQLCWVNN